MPDKGAILEALKNVPDVGGRGDIVSANRVREIEIDDGKVKVTLLLPTIGREEKYRIQDASFDAIKTLEGVVDVSIATTSAQKQAPPPPAGGAPQTGNPFDGQAAIPGVQNIIAVASGKGGVGKSTVCVNLALALKERGARVGLLDADVYGPSLHILLGVAERPGPGRTKEISPVTKDGLRLMSLGFLTDSNTPVIWRGPIVMGVVKKFLVDVEWGELDYLMIDMPPGTGDAQLTLVQTVPLTSAIIVTTPSELALVDAEKGLRMFEQVNAPVMGIIENMSMFVCPHCGESTPIFDTDGGRKISERTKAEVLGQIPLDPRVREGGDSGSPIVKSDPKSPVSRAFLEIADKILKRFPARVR